MKSRLVQCRQEIVVEDDYSVKSEREGLLQIWESCVYLQHVIIHINKDYNGKKIHG